MFQTCKEFGLDDRLSKRIHPLEMVIGALKVLTSTTTRENKKLVKPKGLKRNTIQSLFSF